MSPVDVALFLEKHVATRLTSVSAVEDKKTPPAMLALAKEIMHQVHASKPIKVSSPFPDNKAFKEAYVWFHSIFGKNNMVYTVPKIMDLDHCVDPNFHSLAGSQFIYMDLELAFPDHTICCFSCGSKNLCCQWDNYSKNKTLFPIPDDSNKIWCLAFKYKCQDCKVDFETNDGRFLASLPAYIHNQYPVHPRYADRRKLKHLSKSLSQQLEEEMLTYSNASRFVKKIARRKHVSFVEKAEEFYSRPNVCGAHPRVQKVVHTYPPCDQDCQQQFKAAQESILNPEKMAANDRHKHMIQATTVEELLAVDHTFETLKNYRLEGGKAIFTVFNEKGQIVNLVIVQADNRKV